MVVQSVGLDVAVACCLDLPCNVVDGVDAHSSLCAVDLTAAVVERVTRDIQFVEVEGGMVL